MGRKDFKVPKRVSTGFLKKGTLTLDMDLLSFKAPLLKGCTIPVLPEYNISGSPVFKPWPLPYAPVIGIADSISVVY
jgi:hypothetical protein